MWLKQTPPPPPPAPAPRPSLPGPAAHSRRFVEAIHMRLIELSPTFFMAASDTVSCRGE